MHINFVSSETKPYKVMKKENSNNMTTGNRLGIIAIYLIGLTVVVLQLRSII